MMNPHGREGHLWPLMSPTETSISPLSQTLTIILLKAHLHGGLSGAANCYSHGMLSLPRQRDPTPVLRQLPAGGITPPPTPILCSPSERTMHHCPFPLFLPRLSGPSIENLTSVSFPHSVFLHALLHRIDTAMVNSPMQGPWRAAYGEMSTAVLGASLQNKQLAVHSRSQSCF